MEGAGVRLRRAFGFGDTSELNPFLLFDDFRNDDPPTTWRASRGIPIAASRRSPTFSTARSTMATASAIAALGAGDVQWMTAGRGILHQEMPKGDAAARMHGFQLWANLPASLKMTNRATRTSTPTAFRKSPMTMERGCA